MQEMLFSDSPKECHDIPGHPTLCLMFEAVTWEDGNILQHHKIGTWNLILQSVHKGSDLMNISSV